VSTLLASLHPGPLALGMPFTACMLMYRSSTAACCCVLALRMPLFGTEGIHAQKCTCSQPGKLHGWHVSRHWSNLPADAARIVRELVQLFRAVDEQQRGDADPDETRAVISPNGLREALSHTAEFKLGECLKSPGTLHLKVQGCSRNSVTCSCCMPDFPCGHDALNSRAQAR
jgi:hypothetical protein